MGQGSSSNRESERPEPRFSYTPLREIIDNNLISRTASRIRNFIVAPPIPYTPEPVRDIVYEAPTYSTITWHERAEQAPGSIFSRAYNWVYDKIYTPIVPAPIIPVETPPEPPPPIGIRGVDIIGLGSGIMSGAGGYTGGAGGGDVGAGGHEPPPPIGLRGGDIIGLGSGIMSGGKGAGGYTGGGAGGDDIGAGGDILTPEEQEERDTRKFNNAIQTAFAKHGGFNHYDANLLFDEISNIDRRYLLVVRMDDDETEYAPINHLTRNFFTEVLTGDFFIGSNSEYGSERMNKWESSDIVDISVEVFKPYIYQRETHGAFFPYFNDSNKDLSRYQIWSESQFNQFESISYKPEHCLIHSLLLSDVSAEKIEILKQKHIGAVYIRKKELHELANDLGRNIILHYMDRRKWVNEYKYGTASLQGEPIHLALYKQHYFKYEKCEHANNSLRLIHNLFEGGAFVRKNMVKFEESATCGSLKDHIYLGEIAAEQHRFRRPKEKLKYKTNEIFFADTETYVHNVPHHKLFMLGVVGYEDKEVTIIRNYKERPIHMQLDVFFRKVTGGGKHKALVYFHNLKYDYSILEEFFNVISMCKKGGQLYSVKVRFKEQTIEIRDSYKMIPIKLASFNKELGIKHSKKEAIAYEYYTPDNSNFNLIPVEEYRAKLKVNEYKIFDSVVREHPTFRVVNGIEYFSPLAYYMDYLKEDCNTLKEGMIKFDSLIHSITNLSAFNYLTISSLTHGYMISRGAYDNVYEVRGNLKNYIGRAVMGGRVYVNPLHKCKVIHGKISDFDGVSLYPSAISRLCRERGIPTGPAKRYTTGDIKDWKTHNYSILTIKINSVARNQQIPFIRRKRSDGKLELSNEPPDHEIVVDSSTLEDYINFQGIEFDLIDGVYWGERSEPGVPGDKIMGEVIDELFAQRLKCKREGKIGLSNVLKLMMNSSYGKTIMKPANCKTIIRSTVGWERVTYEDGTTWWKEKKISPMTEYVTQNFKNIKSYRFMNNEKQYQIESMTVDKSYNLAHVGCAILSMSKRIMNEVFDIANSIGVIIYYTDTDSMHLQTDSIVKLNDEYRKIYGKELIGNQLGQFHDDFQLDGAKGPIYSEKSIFLGNKSYIDSLVSNDDSGAVIKGIHSRMKGITVEGLEQKAKEYSNGYMGLYEELATGKSVAILLNPETKVLFEYHNGNVRTRKEFVRHVQFGE